MFRSSLCMTVILMLASTILQAVGGVVAPPKSAVGQKGSQQELNTRNRSYAPSLEATLDRTFLDLPKSALMPISASERRRFEECRRLKGIEADKEGYRWDCALDAGMEDASSEGGAGSGLSTTTDASTEGADSVAEATGKETQSIESTSQEDPTDITNEDNTIKDQSNVGKRGGKGATGFGGEGGGGVGSGGPDFNPGGGGGGGTGSSVRGGGGGSSGSSSAVVNTIASSNSGGSGSSGGSGLSGGNTDGSNSNSDSGSGSGGNPTGGNSGAGGDSKVWLDSTFQQAGNKGMTFQPLDQSGNPVNFFLTARTMVDQSRPLDINASGSIGTIVITDRGAGVQTLSGGGEATIEGQGGMGNEELIFHYDAPVVLHSLQLGLVGVASADGFGSLIDPVLFLVTQDPSLPAIVLDSQALADAFTSTGTDTGWLDFAKFAGTAGLTADTLITEFILRETGGGGILVAYERFAPTMDVPEPSTWLLMATLLLLPALLRRRVGQF